MPILQDTLPFAPWMHPGAARLPGVMPAPPGDWPCVDEAYAAQMAERDRLIRENAAQVHALLPEGRPAADELYRHTLDRLSRMDGFHIGHDTAVRPDGMSVSLDATTPLFTLGRLVQEDLCLLQRGTDGHVLTGAILCFPASWTLSQKIGRPMIPIHDPVPEYSGRIASSVQRMLDSIHPDRPLFRANALSYDDPGLFQPRREGQARPRPVDHVYVRSELQTLLKLPQTGAVVFAIHTRVVRLSSLEDDVRRGFQAYMARQGVDRSPV